MKVRELIKELQDCQEEYGKDFLDWSVYIELQNRGKEELEKAGFKTITDLDEWTYVEQAGWNTKMPKEKIFTVNINY